MSETVASVSALIVKTLLANPKVPRDINGSSKIVEDLAFDSLAVMNFVMEIEDTLMFPCRLTGWLIFAPLMIWRSASSPSSRHPDASCQFSRNMKAWHRH